MIYECCSHRRLDALREFGTANAIDYVEVNDSEAPEESLRQRTLFVRMLRQQPIADNNVVIAGGERVPVSVTWARWGDAVASAGVPDHGVTPAMGAALLDGVNDLATLLVVRTDTRGDFSTYTLRLVTADGTAPLGGVDPQLAEVDFSFKVECPSDFDCAPENDCPPEPFDTPTIDYLAKDYDTFRRLMLDRLSLTVPGWTEHNPADVGVTLVELLAYLADELSYRQDAVSTEAYLATARRRPSLRRHARLVDYVVHEGANARAWVQLKVEGENVDLPEPLQFLTRTGGIPDTVDPGGTDHRRALAAGPTVFEPVDTVFDTDDLIRTPLAGIIRPTLHASLDALDFYTWGDTDCCLPAGSTSATLLGHHATKLIAGQVLVLAEVAGAEKGNPADADPSRRTAVRLTEVVDDEDVSGGLFLTPPDPTKTVGITRISWHPDDALAFPLCLSVPDPPDTAISKAFGNIVLCDHGRSIPDLGTTDDDPLLGTVPGSALEYATVGSGAHCRPTGVDDRSGGSDGAAIVTRAPVPVRFRPTVPGAPLTHADATPAEVARGVATDLPSASRTFGVDPRAARPVITATSHDEVADEVWTPLSDLLAAAGDDLNVVVETEEDGTARLRFGDNVHGRRPDAGMSFTARYRVGNGTAGNIGIGAIAHVAVPDNTGVVGATNLLPARGGVDPEPAEVIRRDAPEAFLVQERAVTEGDYADVTERDPAIQRAAATFRWTGSWNTVFVTADRISGAEIDEGFETSLRRRIEPFRMAGYDLEVDQPSYVALDVELHICVQRDFLRSPVRAAVLEALSSTVHPDGTRGLFHPDHFTFAQPVHLSRIVATAQAVEGVESVTAVRFQRQRDDSTSAIDTGVLTMGRLEIARLDNDPNFPEHGVLTVTAGGGK